MDFAQPLIPGVLIKRYKRFLADVELADGRVVTAHCANPGAMMGLNAPGLEVWLEPNDDPRRKLNFAWRLLRLPGGAWVGIDTSVPNKVIGEALRAGTIAGLDGYDTIRPEQKYSTNSRIDFLLQGAGRPDCYVEVKNVHLSRTPGLAEFPDSVTARGTKHLGDLAAEVRRGNRAVMLYCIQRDDCTRFALARELDTTYGAAFDHARAAGVEVMAVRCTLTTNRISVERPIRIVGASGDE